MHPIHVDAGLLKAESVSPVQAHDYYWSNCIVETLDIAEVPGDHNAMFFPETPPPGRRRPGTPAAERPVTGRGDGYIDTGG